MASVRLRIRDAWLFAQEMRYLADVARERDRDHGLANERLWEAELAERYAFELRLIALRPPGTKKPGTAEAVPGVVRVAA